MSYTERFNARNTTGELDRKVARLHQHYFKSRRGVAGMGKRIKIARGMLNLSQRELAHKLKVTHPVLVRWERSQRYPTVPHLINLARVLSLSYTLLLEGP